MAMVRSARTGTPSAARTIKSIGVESIWTCSSGHAAMVMVNDLCGQFAVIGG